VKSTTQMSTELRFEWRSCNPFLGRIARTSLNSGVYLTGQFKFTQRENRCKNTKSTLKSWWVHSNFEWQNWPLNVHSTFKKM